MKARIAVVTCLVFLATAQVSYAVATVQIDTFQGGLGNWFAGGGPQGGTPANSPLLISTGGPGGAGDAYMQANSSGSGQEGSRLVVMNGAQWAGNYLAAGITQIGMDLINLGSTDLVIRLYLEDPIPGPPQNEAITAGFNLPVGGGWQHAVFSVRPTDLTLLSGNVNTLLGNTTILRIIHNPAAGFPPPQVAASLGIDNIASVPESSTITMIALGVAMGLLTWRTRVS